MWHWFVEKDGVLQAPLVVPVVKNLPVNAGDTDSIPGVGKIPWRRKWKPTSVFLPGKFHGRRATVHRITKSQTQLNTHSCTCIWGLQPQPLSPLLAGWCLMSIKPLKACYPQQESPQAGVKAPSELISHSRQCPFRGSSADLTTAPDGLRSLWLVRQWLSFSPGISARGWYFMWLQEIQLY